MIITPKFVAISGLVSVLIMTIAFGLTLFKLAPEEYIVPLFIVAFLAFAVRIVTRILFKRQQKRFQSEETTADSDE